MKTPVAGKQRGNMLRAGSLGALFSTNPKKSRGIPPHFSKSEETLDSMKQPISDTDEEESDTDISENHSDTETSTTPNYNSRQSKTSKK